jgi:putative tryptophan/tyrosine transport system substrate-binding protein
VIRRAQLLLLLAALVDTPAAAAEVRVLIVASHDAAPYQETAAGFLRGLRQSSKVQSETVALKGDASAAPRLLAQAASQAKRDLVLSLGALATKTALAQWKDVPVVAALVLSSADLRGAANATGVYLEHPVTTQLQLLRRILPDQTVVGLLYSPNENRGRVDEARRVAKQLGLDLEALPVQRAHQIPDQLKALEDRVRVLWGVPDSVVLTPQTARQLLLFSFRNRIPLVAPSSMWVKAGALYALDWDYGDIGGQCAVLAQKILGGAKPRTLSPQAPRKVIYTLNLKTAAHMKIDLPQAVVRAAHRTY